MRYFLPTFIFLFILIFLWKGLRQDPHQLPSVLIGKPVLAFRYPNLLHEEKILTEKIFLGHVSLLNVWGSWCIACRVEHLNLMDIALKNHVVLYGLDYKDDPKIARHWLAIYGNPYRDIILDQEGKLAIDLGVYGTPETFLIDSAGVIRYKYIGPVTRDIWEKQILPEMNRWR